ncbi:hypothetical protein BDZ91DRAFT_763813 [Kalaharituber pfeilii]|nr:hypothetical protein BDZ91DRAFT_763813 [Kalaharituber pfeilii]
MASAILPAAAVFSHGTFLPLLVVLKADNGGTRQDPADISLAPPRATISRSYHPQLEVLAAGEGVLVQEFHRASAVGLRGPHEGRLTCAVANPQVDVRGRLEEQLEAPDVHVDRRICRPNMPVHFESPVVAVRSRGGQRRVVIVALFVQVDTPLHTFQQRLHQCRRSCSCGSANGCQAIHAGRVQVDAREAEDILDNPNVSIETVWLS